MDRNHKVLCFAKKHWFYQGLLKFLSNSPQVNLDKLTRVTILAQGATGGNGVEKGFFGTDTITVGFHLYTL